MNFIIYSNMFAKSLNDIYQNYDAFLIDMYGVLYDGSGMFPNALSLLERMKAEDKKIIILSNTTLVSKACKVKYSEKGLIEGVHYDYFITSGEAFKQTLHNYISNAKTYFQAFHPNNALFEESGLTESQSLEGADFVYIGFLNDVKRIYVADELRDKSGALIPLENLNSTDCHEISDLSEISDFLDRCLSLNKTLIIANPDLFALELVSTNEQPAMRRPVLCQGMIGEFYEKMGGKVVYFGKPYSAIYDFARKFLSPGEKTAMIGDTIWTDILGGNMSGFDSILTLTGVSGEFLKHSGSLNTTEKIDWLLKNISTKMTHKNLLNYSQMPTHVIERFAAL